MSVATKNTLNYLWNKVLILYNKLSARITTLENSTGTYYGTCSTSGSTAAKVVTCDGFVLKEGVEIDVYFSYVNSTTSQITLNVNGTGAKTVYFPNDSTNGYYKIQNNSIVKFRYDGTLWRVVGFPTYTVNDSSAAKSLSSANPYLVTERKVYHGMPKINGSKSYNSNTNIYAPTSTGTSGQILKSTGSGAPVWVDIISVEELEPDAKTGEITAAGATIDTGYIIPHIKKTKIKLGSNIIVFSEYRFSIENITDKDVYINFNNSKFTKYKGTSGCISTHDRQGYNVKMHLDCIGRLGHFHLQMDNIPSGSIAIYISTTYLGVE